MGRSRQGLMAGWVVSPRYSRNCSGLSSQTYAAEMLGRAEIYGESLAVADVQIAVGLGREAGVDLHALAALALGQVLLDKGFDKVSGGFFHAFLSQTKDADIINESGRNYKTQYKLYKI